MRTRLLQAAALGLFFWSGAAGAVDGISLIPIKAEQAKSLLAQQAGPALPSYAPSAIAEHGVLLPDGRPAQASEGDIRAAWLTRPTSRYAHGVLGDAVEAGGVVVALADGSYASFTLPKDSVFEDLTPRLADLDGDGSNEIVLVRSYLNAGGALAVLGLKNGNLQILAETPAIGTANRWLNPSLIGSFDGSDKLTIGLVQTPHIGGQLQLWHYGSGQLTLARKANGFSNHSIGSRALGLSALLHKGDARRILIPDATQSNLLLLDAKSLKPLGRIALPARPSGDFAVVTDNNGHQQVLLPLKDGQTYSLADKSGQLFD